MTALTTTPDLSALAQLSARNTLPVASRVAIKVAYLCLLWSQRSRTRTSLSALPEYQLRDIGLSRREAAEEYGKWFWRP